MADTAPDTVADTVPDTVPTDRLDEARAALRRQDWPTARALLDAQLAERPTPVARMLLARVEHRAGNPEGAGAVLDEIEANNPRHAGAKTLRARIALEGGQVQEARRHAEDALAIAPGTEAAARVLTSVRVLEQRERALAAIAVLDAGDLGARAEERPDDRTDERAEDRTAALRAAAAELATLEVDEHWTDDPVQAKIAYFRHAADPVAALASYDAALIDLSAQCGYITWPKRIQQHVKGRSVLDVGCGFGGYGVGFLVAGATSYLGLDPAMDLDDPKAKDKRLRTWREMPVTPRQIAQQLPAIRLLQGKSEDLDLDETFDTISLHNVTEHLLDLEAVFRGLVPRCHAGTTLVLHHHSFHCWNGHHQPPAHPDQLDLSDAEHREVYDWRHIDAVPHVADDHYYLTGLNRIRLDEFRAAVEEFFDIVSWEEFRSPPATLDRLTPEIVERVRRTIPDLTERELTTNTVLVVCRPKGA